MQTETKCQKYYKCSLKRREQRKKSYQVHRIDILIKRKEHYYLQREQELEWSRRYRELNKDKARKYNEKRYKLYRDEELERCHEYRQTFNGKLANRAKSHRRRALMRGLTLGLILSTVQRVYENNTKKYGTLTCIYCLESVKFGDDHLEHRTPLVKGGTNEYKNLGVACSCCNLRKGSKTEAEYYRQLLIKR